MLDACVLIRAQEAKALDVLLAAGRHVPLEITRDVYVELTAPQTTKAEVRRLAAEAKQVLDASPLQVITLPLEGDIARVMGALYGQRTTSNDAGECASIAYTAITAGRSFVTADRDATFFATREVDGRTIALPWFLRKLVEGGALERRWAVEIQAKDKVRAPEWWGRWAAGG